MQRGVENAFAVNGGVIGESHDDPVACLAEFGGVDDNHSADRVVIGLCTQAFNTQIIMWRAITIVPAIHDIRSPVEKLMPGAVGNEAS